MFNNKVVYGGLSHLFCLQRSRGWDTTRYKTLEAGLQAAVTQETRKAYTIEILQAIGKDDAGFIQSCINKGVDPNTCNAFGQTVS